MNNLTQLSCHVLPFLAISGYFCYPTEFRINPSLLYFLSVAHNWVLILFSGWTFLSLSQILYNRGIVFHSNYYFQNPTFDTVIYYFYLSKYYEFFDIFLLYLNGKTPILLQKYHHIGAVLSWHLMYLYKVEMVWMATLLNSFVHTIMYSYYLGCLLKIKQARFIRKYITSLQLVQFFLLYSNFYFYRPPIETWFNYYIGIFFASYGVGIIGLFGKFYYDNYIRDRIKNV
jgi:GNS1/SUR4 family